MDYHQVRSARRFVLVTVLAFGAYTAVQRATIETPKSEYGIPSLWADGGGGTVRQVAEAPEAPVRDLPGNPIYRPTMASKAVEETALELRVSAERTMHCTVIAPADTTAELPLVLGVTDPSAHGLDRHIRRLASGGYLVVMLPLADHAEGGADAFRSLVSDAREAVTQLGTAMRTHAVRPARSVCLAGSGLSAAPLLALAGVPIDSQTGSRGVFSIPGIKAVMLFDPLLRTDGQRRLNLAAGAAVPVLLVHASADQRLGEGASRLYQVGGGPQHMMDILHYRRIISPAEDADAAFRKDASSMTEAFVDAFLTSSPGAIRYVSSYLGGLSPASASHGRR